MHNFIIKFGKILDICKHFAGNRVNNHGNVTRCGVVPTFSDLEVIALSFTAEAFGFDSENMLFKRLNDSVEKIPNLILGDNSIHAANSRLAWRKIPEKK